jgi:hypothetical protein
MGISRGDARCAVRIQTRDGPGTSLRAILLLDGFEAVAPRAQRPNPEDEDRELVARELERRFLQMSVFYRQPRVERHNSSVPVRDDAKKSSRSSLLKATS